METIKLTGVKCPLCGETSLEAENINMPTSSGRVSIETAIECSTCGTRSPFVRTALDKNFFYVHYDSLLRQFGSQTYDIWLQKITQVGLREARRMIDCAIDPTPQKGHE